MKLSKIAPTILILCLPLVLLASEIKQISIDFYSEQLHFNYHSDITLVSCPKPEAQMMITFFSEMEASNFQPFLNELQASKQKLLLNDWLFYLLLRNTIERIWPTSQGFQQTLYCWFFLSKAGFDTRLTYLDNQVYLNVHSEDEIFEAPLIEDQNKIFVNLTDIYGTMESSGSLYLLEFWPSSPTRPFSFYLDPLPKLKSLQREKTVRFQFQEQDYEFEVQFDETIINIMREYPLVAEAAYLNVPLSETLSSSLLPQLRNLLKDLNEKESLELLVSLTRSSFPYKDDKIFFGKSKPMIPDELFYYKYSDCEDRSAIFYSLVKELLDLPMIIIAYSDHLTIGVATRLDNSVSIPFEGKNYFICDPTGPVNSKEIGIIPNGYENKSFNIIGKYK